ncbi:MAG: hypothetical protein EBU52_12775 [Cytophagia bacterium]|nr:hypothetical protein [Cytophagia bacterium]
MLQRIHWQLTTMALLPTNVPSRNLRKKHQKHGKAFIVKFTTGRTCPIANKFLLKISFKNAFLSGIKGLHASVCPL